MTTTTPTITELRDAANAVVVTALADFRSALAQARSEHEKARARAGSDDEIANASAALERAREEARALYDKRTAPVWSAFIHRIALGD